jgi:pimeloyl-ACP methyl ester carboxylesterase
MSSTLYLDRPGGRIAYDVAGDGPLVVLVPGMGDLRSVYRFLAPALVEAGYRVAAMDLRGHGDSDASFDAYDDVALGGDLAALVEHLGAPAVLVGNSMGASGAALVAAESPELVRGLVLIGPFVRDVPVGVAAKLALRLALVRPWGPSSWSAYYAKLYPGHSPADLDDYRAGLKKSIQRPQHWQAFVATTRTSHAPVDARLDNVTAPTLVVMGERDPDFSDPAGEARMVAERLSGEVVMVPNAGHYPQAEYPEIVTPEVLSFLGRVTQRA